MTMPDLSFKQRLSENRVVLAPGVYDAFTASMAARAGFEALYLSGAAIAYTRLGRPDIGLVSVSELHSDIICFDNSAHSCSSSSSSHS